MAPPRRKLSPEDELGELIAGPGDLSPDDELQGLIAGDSAVGSAAPSGKVITLPTQNITAYEDKEPWVAEMLGQRDKAFTAMGGRHPAEAMAEAGFQTHPLIRGAGVAANMGDAFVKSGIERGARSYDRGDDWLDVLKEGALGGVESAGLAGGLSLLGKGAGAVRNRARMSAFGADDQALHELDMSPQQFNDWTDELGMNNAVVPMSRAGKLKRTRALLNRSGPELSAAIQEAQDMGIGQNRDWGGEIARDLDTTADQVWVGGAGSREEVVHQMQKAAGAANDATNLNSLQDLRRFKTARAGEAYKNARGALNESAASKASLAAADSSGQLLDSSMQQAGPGIDARFQQANSEFADGKVLEEMLLQKQGMGMMGNGIADAAAATAGAIATGGNPYGAGAGVLARRAAAPFAADATANLANAAQGASQGAARATPAAVSALTPQQSTGAGRGNRDGDAAFDLLQSDPQALGRWAPEIEQAAASGELDRLLSRLKRDPEFRTGPLLRIQQLTAGGMR